MENNKNNLQNLEFLSLGGSGTVTKNMHLYMLGEEILIVDCGIGFTTQNMLGAQLIVPDISYLLKLLKSGKRIVGMLLTHGHEDHIGSLPFVLPKLPNFPIFATSFTTDLANAKLSELGIQNKIKKINYKEELQLGNNFKATFIHVTHSIPDTAHIFIQTPAGNFYHGSDYKLDSKPYLGEVSDLEAIKSCGEKGVKALFLDALGAGRQKTDRSEFNVEDNFKKVFEKSTGRVIVTTFSSHIARLSLIVDAAKNTNRKVCFIGRSVIKAKDMAQRLNLFKVSEQDELQLQDLNRINDRNVVVIIAGSQGQENSAFFRFIVGEHKDIKLKSNDTVIFSSDPIPGNEVAISDLIEVLSKRAVRVYLSEHDEKFHVSGHGSNEDIEQMVNMIKPKFIGPIGGTFYKMRQFEDLALDLGFRKDQIIFLDEGVGAIFEKDKFTLSPKINLEKIYIDDRNSEEMENFVLMDRKKISKEGIVILLLEIDSNTGGIFGKPQVITRGISNYDRVKLEKRIDHTLKNFSSPNTTNDELVIRRIIKEKIEKEVWMKMRKKPLIMPITISV